MPKSWITLMNGYKARIIAGQLKVPSRSSKRRGSAFARGGPHARPSPFRVRIAQRGDGERRSSSRCAASRKAFPGVVANDDVDFDVRAGRGARAPRRERRRQVDADEHPLRALPPGRGRDPAARQAGHVQLGEGRDQRGHRHGAPALHAHPGDDGRREHRARRSSRARTGSSSTSAARRSACASCRSSSASPSTRRRSSARSPSASSSASRS